MILGATFSASTERTGTAVATNPGMQTHGTGRCLTALDSALGTGRCSEHGLCPARWGRVKLKFFDYYWILVVVQAKSLIL